MEDLREKDAEIERLRNLINSSAESMQAVINKQRKLIAELADALESEMSCSQPPIHGSDDWINLTDLIRRAREVK